MKTHVLYLQHSGYVLDIGKECDCVKPFFYLKALLTFRIIF